MMAMIPMIVLSACSTSPKADPLAELHAAHSSSTSVLPASYTGNPDGPAKKACEAWTLTSKQVEAFFNLSEEYSDNPYSGFYQLPCSISGDITADGRTWHYKINGGGTATWKNDDDERYWGCSASECEPLVMMFTDSMSGK